MWVEEGVRGRGAGKVDVEGMVDEGERYGECGCGWKNGFWGRDVGKVHVEGSTRCGWESRLEIGN